MSNRRKMTLTSKSVATIIVSMWLTVTTLGVQQSMVWEVDYNAQKDLTTVRLPFSRISGVQDRYHSLDFSIYFTYRGKTKPTPESVNLELISVVKARKLNSDLYVVFVVDGEQLHFGSNRSAIANPVKGRTWVGERMVFSIPVEKFQTLAKGKKVEIKMGGVVFPLSDEARASLRAFASECCGERQSDNQSSGSSRFKASANFSTSTFVCSIARRLSR
jgi:hypothetical protein